MAPKLRSQNNENSEKTKKQIDNNKSKARGDSGRSIHPTLDLKTTETLRKQQRTKNDDKGSCSNSNTQTHSQSDRKQFADSAPRQYRELRIIIKPLSYDELKKHGLKVTELKAGTEKITDNGENVTENVRSKPSSPLKSRKRKRNQDENVFGGQKENKSKEGYMLRNKLTTNTAVTETGNQNQLRAEGNSGSHQNDRIAPTLNSQPKRRTNSKTQNINMKEHNTRSKNSTINEVIKSSALKPNLETSTRKCKRNDYDSGAELNMELERQENSSPRLALKTQKRKRNQNDLDSQKENKAKNGYMLRNRLTSNTVTTETGNQKQLPTKSNSATNRTASTAKSQTKRAAQLQLQERLLHDVPTKEYLPNEIILATIPGYAPWPARILEMIGQTILVEFFGTGEKNLVRPNTICHFDIKKVLPLLNRKGYKKAIIELELCLGIPKSLSVIS